ncbi:MAG: KpsF/GutQ family sugar-phosphate isomerase [Alphaproteobacteria bacterium]|nr:KpsF/GutQ family sugar-phosphate isomerase [Alphaproteobacteria bacterium]MCD8526503.1 KpsF/GutQ family sugar-phosphate isomerase [Alphaproteobacteria bacterium]MCD8570356.1 KpsF/GutQ family sugar-phosphate isomerase [Alphaproteobacteria bacterium]
MTAPHSKSAFSGSVDVLAIARQALATEIEGLQALHKALDHNFTAGVEKIHAMKQTGQGRLIVAGIGKSGHVSRKIAATLASTGTPAYFVHPGEASHGDMGMIAQADIVLMLSNSGENAELSDLIHYTRRYGITLIAMTSNPESTLAKHADIILQLPKVPEACPNGLAPTTSTTMMMALGDALAVSLLECMGLTPDQYKVFHPGGKLGQRLKKVSDIMVPLADMPLLDEGATMDKAILLLSEKNLGAVIIIGKNKDLKGIITDGDLKRHMAPDLLAKPVSAVMSPTPRTIEASLLAVKALDMMTGTPGHYLTSLIVTDNGKLAGMIRLQDCLQAGLG